MRSRSKLMNYAYLGLAGLLFAVMIYLFFVYPGKSIGPKQPIYFSHRVHTGVKGIDCRFCHPFVERSSNAGIPSMAKCFYCHEYIIPTHPQIVKEREHYDQKKPVPWVRVTYIPDFTFFNHLPHIRWAGLDCAECHGEVRKMDRLVQTSFEMGFCVDCHRRMNAQIDCWLACHR